MKRLVMALTMLAALPLAADEKKEPAAPPPPAAKDSPLVQAAKRANRAKSKSIVINMETLRASTGRLSVATGTQAPISNPVTTGPENRYDGSKAAAAQEAAAQQQAAKQRQAEADRKAVRAESEYEEEDGPPPPKPD
jgi:hypothetical protein